MDISNFFQELKFGIDFIDKINTVRITSLIMIIILDILVCILVALLEKKKEKEV